jgi:hypothetical protein
VLRNTFSTWKSEKGREWGEDLGGSRKRKRIGKKIEV